MDQPIYQQRQLPPLVEFRVNVILDQLIRSGVSDEEIDSVTPAVTEAIFVSSRAHTVNRVLTLVYSLGFYGVLLVPPLLIYRWVKKEGILAGGTEFQLSVTILSLVWAWVSVNMLRQYLIRPGMRDFFRLKEQRNNRNTAVTSDIEFILNIIIIGTATLMLIASVVGAVEVIIPSMYYWSIWQSATIILASFWIYTILKITNAAILAGGKLLAYFRPDCALILYFAEAFLYVCQKDAWRYASHRDSIAVQIGLAANILENFMPRYFAIDSNARSMIRQRFREAAIALRQKILWLATPGPLTRADLEWELRKALVAASTGQLDQLGGRPDDLSQTIPVQGRNWWNELPDLFRGIAWALTPLVLVQLGTALHLQLLSDPEQQLAAKRAALLWLGIVILRALSPGNFKETIEAATSLLGRGREGHQA